MTVEAGLCGPVATFTYKALVSFAIAGRGEEGPTSVVILGGTLRGVVSSLLAWDSLRSRHDEE